MKLTLALVVLSLCSCKSKRGRLYLEMELDDGRQLYEGMQYEQLTEVMGEPDHVAFGEDRVYFSEFKDGAIDPEWTEWAWKGPDKTYVVYLHYVRANVQKCGVVPSPR